MIIAPSESAEYMKREMMSSFGWDFAHWKKKESSASVDVTDPVLRLQKSINMSIRWIFLSTSESLWRESWKKKSPKGSS